MIRSIVKQDGQAVLLNDCLSHLIKLGFDMHDVKIKTALISVTNKTELAAFSQGLTAYQVEFISTGDTFKLLSKLGVDVKEVSDYTGFPEMMGGRVKTLHPKIHGGILGRRHANNPENDLEIMAAQEIKAIDLLAVNLYPFTQAIANPDCDLAQAIEHIDIGGQTMLRSAAKNFYSVAVIVDIEDYPIILAEMEARHGCISLQTRFRLAVKAFEHVTQYDAAISNYLGSIELDPPKRRTFPNSFTKQYIKKQTMRYGENPHQEAAFYVDPSESSANVASAHQVHGKALSFNNVNDTDTALTCVQAFNEPACVIVKHANPCGVAVANSIARAYQLAFAADPTSAFGGIIACNRHLDAKAAKLMLENQFIEVIVAPHIAKDALEILRQKKNVRVLTCGELTKVQADEQYQDPVGKLDYQKVTGGLLIQHQDQVLLDESSLQVVTARIPTSAETRDLMFAWTVAKFVKSNAIVYAKDQRTIGIGAGQMSRVYSAIIANLKARDENLQVAGSVMASDAFFPFRDSIDAAAEAGITAVIEPGGSIRDDEVIAAANETDMAMMFTGMRHFRH